MIVGFFQVVFLPVFLHQIIFGGVFIIDSFDAEEIPDSPLRIAFPFKNIYFMYCIIKNIPRWRFLSILTTWCKLVLIISIYLASNPLVNTYFVIDSHCNLSTIRYSLFKFNLQFVSKGQRCSFLFLPGFPSITCS